ncbi:MAG: VanZ family protein [Halopseudomonas sp.]
MIKLLSLIKSHWLALTLFQLTAITTLSLWPFDQLPAFPGSDKTHHLIGYAALMFPTALRQPKHWLMLGLCFIGWSGAIELIQPYVNRYGEWLDLAANSAGVVLGYGTARLASRLLSSPKTSTVLD